jgi:hypothetical protein
VARYRHKDEPDLAWNKVRRRVTAEVTIACQDVREEILNIALNDAWQKFSDALGEGKLPEVEGRYQKLVMAILQDSVPRIMEAGGVEPAEVE